MDARHCCLALLLLLGGALPAGASQAYPVEAAAATAAIANQPLDLRAVGPPETLGPNLVQNPAFDSIPPWQHTTGALRTQAIATVDQGVALLEAMQPSGSGTISVSQQLGFPGRHPFRVQYRAIDLGATPTRITILLRETLANGTLQETRFVHLATPQWATYSWLWTPKADEARSVTLFLQVAIQAGAVQEVRFDDAQLNPVAKVDWSVPGGRVLDASLLGARIVFQAKGPQTVYANATDNGVPLWSAVGTFVLEDQAPVANLSAPGMAVLNQPFVLDASRTADADSPLALADPGFASLGTVWRVGMSAGAALAARALDDPGGGVELSIAGVNRSGYAFVSQALLPGPARSGLLSVRVQDTGDFAGYALLLRESNGTATRDTLLAAPPTGGHMERLTLPWAAQLPGTLQLTAFLRVRLAEDSSAVIRFLEPRLQSGLNFTWTLDGAIVRTGPDPTYTFVPRQPGLHIAAVAVGDPEGQVSTATAIVRAVDLGYMWAVPPPGLAPLAPATSLGLDTIQRTEGGEDQLGNGGFQDGSQAWTLGPRSFDGTLSWSVLAESGIPYARVTAHARGGGTAWLQQDPGLLCGQVNCTLSFDYRGTAPLDLLLRANVTGAPDVDRRVEIPASGAWRHASVLWSPPGGRLIVFLRFRAAPGSNATVDFRAVSLQPSLDLDASLRGPDGATLENGTASFAVPGTYSIAVQVANAHGQAGRLERSIEVLPVAFFPVPSGRLAIRIAGTADAAAILLDAANRTRARIDLRDGALPDGLDALARGGERFLRLSVAPTDRVVLQSSTATSTYDAADLMAVDLAAGLASANATVTEAGWSSVVAVRITTADQAASNGTVRVFDAGRLVAQGSLARDGRDLVASVRLPVAFAARNLTVGYDARDAWGEGLALPQQAIEVPVNPLLGGGLALLGLAIVVTMAGAAYRFLRRREAP